MRWDGPSLETKMDHPRIWKMQFNLDIFNTSMAGLTTTEERSDFLVGFAMGVNGKNPTPPNTPPTRDGYTLGHSMRSEAEAFIAQSVIDGNKGGPKSWKSRKLDAMSNLTPSITPGTRVAEPNLSIYQSSNSTITTNPPSVDQPKQKPPKEKKIKVKFSEHSDEVKEIVNTLSMEWRTEDPASDKRPIKISRVGFASNIKDILRDHPELTLEMLIQAGRNYCAEDFWRFKAPQHFFGPEGPWPKYIEDIMTTTPKEEVSVTE